MGNFNSMLKSLRLSQGLTQDELAKNLKISRSAVGMYEAGEREPDYETLELIADFFNVDIDYLLGRTNKTTKVIQPNTPNAQADYYLNEETEQIAQEIFENKDLKMLFDTAKDCSPEDMKKVIAMIKAFKGEL